MAKSVTIVEGSKPVSLAGVSKLLVPEQSGLYSVWVPKDERLVKPLYVTSNGTYDASDELSHGLSPIVVNVAGGNEWKDSSGATVQPPIGGRGCSLLAYDPISARVVQMAVMPDGTIGEVDNRDKPKSVEPASKPYMAKYRGTYALVGGVDSTGDYARGREDCWGNNYESGVYRNGAHSAMSLSFTVICQSESELFVRRLGDLMYEETDVVMGCTRFDGQLDFDEYGSQISAVGDGLAQGGYRFSTVYQSPSVETARFLGGGTDATVIDIRMDITVTPPILRNPVWGGIRRVVENNRTRQFFGLVNTVVDLDFLSGLSYGTHGGHLNGLLGTHYGRWENNVGDEWIRLLDYDGGDACTLEVKFDMLPNYATWGFRTMPPLLDFRVYDVWAYMQFIETDNPYLTSLYAVYGHDTCSDLISLKVLPNSIEYCGPVSEAPESAFILD